MDKQTQKGGGSLVAIYLTTVLLLLAGVVLAVCAGKYSVTPAESLHILVSGILGRDSGYPLMTQNVVMGLRVPRILGSILVGSSLSISGAAYQGSFKNQLVSPELLGISSGACIGAAAGILLGLSTAYISLMAFWGGIAAVALTMSIPMLIGNRSNVVLVLSGVIVGSTMSSILGFVKYIADPQTQLASITYWSMGSFAYVTLGELMILLPVLLIPTVVLLMLSWWIDVLSMGETEARTLGANVNLVRGTTIACATLLTAGSVCIAGTIGWVGLIVPHFGRMLAGPSNRRLMPLCGLLGGLFMLTVDTLTRTIGVSEMPVSILTGVIGAPFYCWLLFRQRRSLA